LQQEFETVWCKCVHKYINGKMRPVETIPGMGERRLRIMMEGMNSTMIL
jgi:hypothetical protein